jgi:hypothetical protein
VKSVVPELEMVIDPSQPTWVRKLLNVPGLLLGSGEKNDENGITELGVSVPPGKIIVGVIPPNGVVLSRELAK